MNQYGLGSRTYLVRLTAAPGQDRTFTLPTSSTTALERGFRLLFYESRGEDNAKGTLTGWGSIDKLLPSEESVTISLRDYVAFKRRVPFTDLRADPRRDRDAEVQQISADVFNAALAKARR
ncbi:MAG: hypothetical protein AB7R89_15145 [Dehalococcoidia bacterium]